ncbi:MAG: ATP-binding protein [Bacteroidales bacterium]|nr:ATP-binding protein [Bacteroidales bacterium]
MKIIRNIYLQRLIARRHNGMAKVITGIRRCGKSYLLFNLYVDWLKKQGVKDSQLICLNLEDFANRNLRNPDILYAYIKSHINGEDMHYVLLDEVQLVPQFEEVINGILSLSNTDVYVTGSNAKYLSKDIITEFRGRGDEVQIYPLSFCEFMSVYDGSSQKGFDEYMIYGGLPQILLQPTEEQKVNYLINLMKETYLRDIKERHKLRTDREMDDLVNIVASSIGSLTNPSTIANTFKSLYKSSLTADTVKIYLEHLTDAFIIERSKRFDVKGRRYVDTPYKYYFSDTGLRNARLGFSQIDEGHLMENIIYNELRIRGYNVDVGFVAVEKRDKEGKKKRSQYEVDFVCHLGSRRYYIQASYEMNSPEKKQQEMASLSHIRDSFKKIVITANDIHIRHDNQGITIISIYDFLLNPNSLEL